MPVKKNRKYQIGERLISKQDIEDEVFLKSNVYYVSLVGAGLGSQKYTRKFCPTYPEAMVLCMAYIIEGKRALLYFDSPDHSGYLIPRDMFEHYLKLYNKSTGQKLGMPVWWDPSKLNAKTKG